MVGPGTFRDIYGVGDREPGPEQSPIAKAVRIVDPRIAAEAEARAGEQEASTQYIPHITTPTPGEEVGRGLLLDLRTAFGEAWFNELGAARAQLQSILQQDYNQLIETDVTPEDAEKSLIAKYGQIVEGTAGGRVTASGYGLQFANALKEVVSPTDIDEATQTDENGINRFAVMLQEELELETYEEALALYNDNIDGALQTIAANPKYANEVPYKWRITVEEGKAPPLAGFYKRMMIGEFGEEEVERLQHPDTDPQELIDAYTLIVGQYKSYPSHWSKLYAADADAPGGAGGPGGIGTGTGPRPDVKYVFETSTDGTVFRAGDDGSFEKVGKYDNLADHPNMQFQRDETTGDLLAFDPQDPTNVINLGKKSWASIDPERDFTEGIRQFDETLGWQKDKWLNEFQENRYQFDAAHTERLREFQITEGRLQQQLAADVGLGLGRMSLEQAEYARQVLRDPQDFLARAYATRGEKSPLGEISQADLMNELNKAFASIAGFTEAQITGGTERLRRPYDTPTRASLDPIAREREAMEETIPDPDAAAAAAAAAAGPRLGGGTATFKDEDHPIYGSPLAEEWAEDRFDPDTLAQLRAQGLTGFGGEVEGASPWTGARYDYTPEGGFRLNTPETLPITQQPRLDPEPNGGGVTFTPEQQAEIDAATQSLVTDIGAVPGGAIGNYAREDPAFTDQWLDVTDPQRIDRSLRPLGLLEPVDQPPIMVDQSQIQMPGYDEAGYVIPELEPDPIYDEIGFAHGGRLHRPAYRGGGRLQNTQGGMGIVGDSGTGRENRELLLLSPGSSATIIPENKLPRNALRGRLQAPMYQAGGKTKRGVSTTEGLSATELQGLQERARRAGFTGAFRNPAAPSPTPDLPRRPDGFNVTVPDVPGRLQDPGFYKTVPARPGGRTIPLPSRPPGYDYGKPMLPDTGVYPSAPPDLGLKPRQPGMGLKPRQPGMPPGRPGLPGITPEEPYTPPQFLPEEPYLPAPVYPQPPAPVQEWRPAPVATSPVYRQPPLRLMPPQQAAPRLLYDPLGREQRNVGRMGGIPRYQEGGILNGGKTIGEGSGWYVDPPEKLRPVIGPNYDPTGGEADPGADFDFDLAEAQADPNYVAGTYGNRLGGIEGWGQTVVYDPVTGRNAYGRTREESAADLAANRQISAAQAQSPATSPKPERPPLPPTGPNVVSDLFKNLIPEETVTQADLRAMAVANQPPAVRDLLAGRRPHRFEPGGTTGQRLFSPQQLARLTQDEQGALRTRLAVENLSLDDFLFAQRQRFGNQRETARGRLAFR